MGARQITFAACLCFAVCAGLRAADSATSDKSDKTAEELDKLRHEKLKVAEQRYNAVAASFESGISSVTDVYQASKDWKGAAYDQASSKKERVAALKDHYDRMADLYKHVHALEQVNAKGGEAEKHASTHFWELEAKIWVLEETAKP